MVASVIAATAIGSTAVAQSAPAGAPSVVDAERVPTAPAAAVQADAAASWRESATPTAVKQRPSRAAARQALIVHQAAYTKFTTKSKATRDMRGVEKSLYRGRYYNKASEAKRLCVVRRESEGHYDVVNPGGSYFGAYQVSRGLARGATWMMLKEHKKLMGAKAAKRVLADLRSKPMNRWPRYWQDAAFHTIINYKGTLSGASHWAGGRWHC
jgi:hypothetical protein